jgi:hypothetical protein
MARKLNSQTFPSVSAARRCRDVLVGSHHRVRVHAVRDLVEMRADDVALASLTGPDPRRTLPAAIVAAVGETGGAVPAGALAVTGGAVAVRVRRLLAPAEPLPRAGRAGALCSAVALLLVPTLLLLLPAFGA